MRDLLLTAGAGCGRLRQVQQVFATQHLIHTAIGFLLDDVLL